MEQGIVNESNNLKKYGLIATGIVGCASVAISVICIPFLTPALRRICLPYVPATTTQVQNVLKALQGKKGPLLDLGSGDGRIVHAAATSGLKCCGVELNPWLVWYSRIRSLQLGLLSNTSFIRKNLWKINTSNYSVVVIFGVESMMSDLEVKLQKELEPNSYAIACRFPFPNWSVEDTIGHGIDSVWIYKQQNSST